MSGEAFPRIMGIVNVTPDSFSDGGDFSNTERASNHAFNLLENGADILDIGGESTRPGANPVTESEEIQRTIPVIEKVLQKYPDANISIDTSKYEVAKLALEAGAKMVNDVTGLSLSPKIADLVASHDADLCVMHIKGEPRSMQKNPFYGDIIKEIYDYLAERSELACKKGVKNTFVDVGIGFGKTVDDNLKLLKNLEKFNNLGSGQLLGISRKSFMGKTLKINHPKERDVPTAFLHSLLLTKNIKIIRVHNVSLIADLKSCYNLIYK